MVKLCYKQWKNNILTVYIGGIVMAKKSSTKNKSTLTGTNAADVLTVQHSQVNVKAVKGNDKITVSKGTSNVLYGGAGNDTITIGKSAGKGNKVYGDAGNDTVKVNTKYGVTINGGAGNDKLYGGKGNDTFTGGKGKDTFFYANGGGKDTITDYQAGQDTLQITSGSISKTAIAKNKKDLVFNVGKGAITLKNSAAKTISLKDSRGSYTVSKTAITLGSNFTGTMDATKYLSTVKTIDGRSVAKKVNITGNKQNNTIYAGKAGGTLNGGAGNDTITINDGTQTKGNNYTLRGGTGTDNYVINSAFIAGTKISINQSDFNSGDTDVLTLAKVNKNDVTYRLDSGTLVITHKSGGTVSVAGWGTNPLSKIQYADGNPITSREINVPLDPSPSYKVIDISTTGIYQGSNSQEIFRFSGNGWNATVQGADSKDILDFSNYKDGTYDFDNVFRSGDDLTLSFVRKTGSQEDEVIGTVTVKDYFVTDNRIADVQWYNADENKTETVTIISELDPKGFNGITVNGTPQRDWIIPLTSAKYVNGLANNDRINVAGGEFRGISGGDGDDTITVMGGNHAEGGVTGGDGDDIITIGTGAVLSYVYGDKGTNMITVKSGASVGRIVAEYEEDEDTPVTIVNDTINIKADAGNVSDIFLRSGTNTVNIAGGTGGENGLTITTDESFIKEYKNKGADYINVSKGNVTIRQSKCSESHVTVNWSDHFGVLTIVMDKYNGSIDNFDKSLTINGAVLSDFTAVHLNQNQGISLIDKTDSNSRLDIYWGAYKTEGAWAGGLDYWGLKYDGITFNNTKLSFTEIYANVTNS